MQTAVLIIAIIFSVLVNKSTGQYSFVNYDYTNGLPLDEIKVVAEDSIGYIWLGGPLGLSRFDGNNFTHYFKNSPTNKVAGNIVNGITVTPTGDVVVVYDDNGISIYDHKTDTFRSKIHTESDSSNFPKYSIIFARVLNDSIAILGANREGLYKLNLKTLDSRKLPIEYIPFDLIIDPEDKDKFFVSGRKGLARMDTNGFGLESISKVGFSGLKLIDGDLWTNAYGAKIHRHNLKSGKDTSYPLSFQGVIRGWTLVDGNLWVGTAEGLEIIDTTSGKVISILKSGSAASDLKGSFIYDVYKDSKNRIWIASDGGLSLYDPAKIQFERTDWLPFQSTYLSPLADNEILSLDFYQNEIFHIDRNKKSSKVKILNDLRGPSETILEGDNIYVLFYNGVGKYDPLRRTITTVSTPYSNPLKKGLIQLLIHEENWFGIYRHQHQFANWNSRTGVYDTIPLGGEPRGMIDTKDGNIWIYGTAILWQYNWKDKTAQKHSLINEELSNLFSEIVQIDEGEDFYWISTRINGIWKAKYQNGSFKLEKHFSESDGLTNNNVVHTYTDKNKILYVQCRGGLYYYDKNSDRFNSVGAKNTINIQTSYGLSVIDSVLHVIGYKSKSIDLRKLKNSKTPINTIIENIQINGKLNIEMNERPTILKYNENSIGITFTTLEFTDPSSIRHRYRLDTISNWMYKEANSKTIQLSALTNGDYYFQLAATDGNGLWTKPLNWRFSIKPPYWRSWWFLISLFGFVVISGYTISHFRMKQVKKISDMKVLLAELEGESLRSQMNPHFVFNALNSIKSYIIKNSKEEAADYLTKFSQLIRAVLRNSTQKEISLKDEIEALTLYLQIENLRLNRPFDFRINIDSNIDPSSIAFPPLIIQPFVENSIWHGFVHKKTAGKLTINVRKKDDIMTIDVIDDGIGRKKSREIEESRERNRSYGIAITETRLNNITEKADIQIFDLFDEDGVSRGTKVQIELPFKRLKAKND